MDVLIRPAMPYDAAALYALALATPELQTSASFAFMERDELATAIRNSNGVMLCAEAKEELVGFIYATHPAGTRRAG